MGVFLLSLIALFLVAVLAFGIYNISHEQTL